MEIDPLIKNRSKLGKVTLNEKESVALAAFKGCNDGGQLPTSHTLPSESPSVSALAAKGAEQVTIAVSEINSSFDFMVDPSARLSDSTG